MKPLASSLAKSIAASGRKTVAVVDFTDLQGNVTELGRFLAEELSVDLVAGAKGFEVIERTQLRATLKEHRLSATGLIDPQTARKLGQIAGVDALLTATITPLGDTVRLSAKVLDAETAKMLGASTADIPRTKGIEDLLQRSISGTEPSKSTSGTSGDIDSAQKTAPSKSITSPVTFAIKDCVYTSFRIELAFTPKLCRRQREGVVCFVQVVNKGEQGIRFNVNAGGSSLVDERGNQYKLDSLLAGQVQDLRLEPEIPLNIIATADKFSDQGTRMHLLLNFGAGSCANYSIGVRDIPVDQH